MKVIQLPEELPPGNLLFAPRLAPRVVKGAQDGLDLGLSEFTNLAPQRLRGIMACVMEMRGAPLQVLLLFVKDSRPLMVQGAKVKLASFELEEARPPESLRILIRHLGDLAPQLAVDAGTHRFLEGDALPDIGKRIVDAATTFGGLLPKKTETETDAAEEETPEATESTPTEEPVTEEPASEEPVTEEPVTEEPVTEEPVTEEPVTEEPVTEEPVTEKADAEEPVPEELTTEPMPATTPLAEMTDRVVAEIASSSSILHVPPPRRSEEVPSTATTAAPPSSPSPSADACRLWLDPKQQCLLASDGEALLVSRSNPADLKTWADAIRGGKNPRIVLGTDATSIPVAALLRVERLRERRRFVLIFQESGNTPRKERLPYSDSSSGNHLDDLLTGLLTDWRRHRRTLSLRTALFPLLAFPGILAVFWLGLLGLAAQQDETGQLETLFGSLGSEGAVLVGLVLLCLAFVPAMRRLRQPPPEIEELLPPKKFED